MDESGRGVFLYTPVPYWGVFVLLLYRHDLSRLCHPFRDDGSPRNWWSVLNHLGLLELRASHARGRAGEGSSFPTSSSFQCRRRLSLSWTLGCSLFLVLPRHRPRISAIVLTAATMQYLGPPPRRPYVDVLRYPRLGSRIRHLPQMPSTEGAKNKKLPKQGQKKASRLTKAKRYLVAPFQLAEEEAEEMTASVQVRRSPFSNHPRARRRSGSSMSPSGTGSSSPPPHTRRSRHSAPTSSAPLRRPTPTSPGSSSSSSGRATAQP